MTNSSDEFSDGQLESVFEERAEYLDERHLTRWTRLTGREERALKKLMGSGAKLLVGPRGCGKSTLMKLALFKLTESRESFPVYVNYSKSFALEPLFFARADALQLFRAWLHAKIVIGAADTLRSLQLAPPKEVSALKTISDRYIRLLESGGRDDSAAPLAKELTGTQILELIDLLAAFSEKERVVLLLDDAAHAFSSEQQREFFEVFRNLRSRNCAPKAAIYPGITSFSPNFHVGHEAELIEAWYGVDDPQYLDNMRSIVTRRLPPRLQSALNNKEDIVDFLAYASFGLPRTFLNMLSSVVLEIEHRSGARVSSQAQSAVVTSCANTRKIFSSLSIKLPKLKNYVNSGEVVSSRLIEIVKSYNASQVDAQKKTAVVAIEEPISKSLERILHMLEYSGLVREVASLSKGQKGTFRRYQVSYGSLIAENAFALGKSFSLRAVNEVLSSRNAHAFARSKDTRLLSEEEAIGCTMNLLPCKACGTERQYPEQRFCMNCGKSLQNSSVYLELLSTTVEQLPLPSAKIDGILKHTSIRTVQNVLMDDESQELRKIPWVGPVWSKRIRTIAEEFVGV